MYMEKEMATYSSVLAWRIPGTAEPGGLQSVGSQRVGHDWATSLTHSLTHSTHNKTTPLFEIQVPLLLQMDGSDDFCDNSH